MRRFWLGCLGLVIGLTPIRAAETEGKVVQDVWNAAHLGGSKAGFVHSQVVEIERNGKKLLRSTLQMELSATRFGSPIKLRMEIGNDETPDGKVTGIVIRHFLGKQQQLLVTGAVEGPELVVTFKGGMNKEKRIPWNNDVVGLYGQDRLFQNVKPGDDFSFISFEPTINSTARTQVHVKDYEMVEVLTPGKGTKSKKRLLRVEAVPDKIEIKKDTYLQLPTLVAWLDKDFQTARSEAEVPGLGNMVLYRTTKEIATRAGVAPAIGNMSLVRLNKAIAKPYETTSAVYRISLKKGGDPKTAFSTDGRQRVANIKGNSFELHVDASEQETADPAAQPGAEFLKTSYFVNSEDALVKKYSRQAVGKEQNPRRKALRISHWVFHHIDKKNYTEAFATSDEAARTLEGDCTEHSVLAAAMCRAAGVPSRTALGLVYADDRSRGPIMAFHMWIEVWLDGKWVPLDPTLGLDSVGATHLKVTDHSWDQVTDLTPLLPVINVVGRLTIQVISAN
jgi:transglutaminase-like putative cysteine protease